MALFTNAPLWVWPLLALLIVVGLNAMRTRQTLALAIYGLPLLGILPLRTVAGLEAAPWVWAVFAGAYALGAVIGFRFQAPRVLAKQSGRVRLRGEALTLVAVLVIFLANFLRGVLDAVAPQALESAGFAAALAGVLALVAGSFLGRALCVFTTR